MAMLRTPNHRCGARSRSRVEGAAVLVPSSLEQLESRALLSADVEYSEADLMMTALTVQSSTPRAVVLPTVTIVATDRLASETGPNKGVFTITRTGSTAKALTVNYTISGAAKNGVDYKTITTSVVIPVGKTSAVVNIVPIDDKLIEKPEGVTLTLAANKAYKVGSPATATVSISNNDGNVVTVSAKDAFAAEFPAQNPLPELNSAGQFVISRTGDLTKPLTVSFSLTGSATYGRDYAAVAKTAVIAAGKRSVAININAVDDLVPEATESVTLTLAAGFYVPGTTTRASLTIADNDSDFIGVPALTLLGPDYQGQQGHVFHQTLPNAQNERKLTDLTNALNLLAVGDDYAVNISPDGQWIVLHTTRWGGTGAEGSLALVPVSDFSKGAQIRIDGANIIPVDGLSAVANGGALVVYASTDGPHQVDLWAASKSGSTWTKTLLTNDSPYDFNIQPSISADGTKVLFVGGSALDDGDAVLEATISNASVVELFNQTQGPAGSPATANIQYPNYGFTLDAFQNKVPRVVFQADWSSEWNDVTGQLERVTRPWAFQNGSVGNAPLGRQGRTVAAGEGEQPQIPYQTRGIAIASTGQIVTLSDERLGNNPGILEVVLKDIDGFYVDRLIGEGLAPWPTVGLGIGG